MSNRTRRDMARVHAKQPWDCTICGKRVFGNGGKSSHMRKHIRDAGLREEDYETVLKGFIAAREVTT